MTITIQRMARPLFIFSLLALLGCDSPPEARPPELIWSRKGLDDGQFSKPRAIAIDKDDRLYIVDMTARIQVFDRDGNFLRKWQTPTCENGRPSGLAFDRQGNLRVADTHYFRILCYTPQGEMLEQRNFGGTCGFGPGEFHFVTDYAEDAAGNFYISEYGENDRIQKFGPDGKFLLEWGGHGSEPGQFLRPQKMDLDEKGNVWVADAANHRVQVFDTSSGKAELVKIWGKQGSAVGELNYPYDILLDGEFVYLCEFGNHRVQKFTRDGEPVAWWGRNGRKPGELDQPWGIVKDSQGRIHVLDSYNHRVQRIRL